MGSHDMKYTGRERQKRPAINEPPFRNQKGRQYFEEAFPIKNLTAIDKAFLVFRAPGVRNILGIAGR